MKTITRDNMERIVWQAVNEWADETGCWPSKVLIRGKEFPATQRGVDEAVEMLMAMDLHPSKPLKHRRTTVGELLGGMNDSGETVGPTATLEGLRPRRNGLSRFLRALRTGRKVKL